MGKILILVLVGLALVQLSGATEQEAEKQISLLENQENLQVQELADPKRGRNGAGKKRKRTKKNKKGRRKAKQSKKRSKKNKNKKGKKNGNRRNKKARRKAKQSQKSKKRSKKNKNKKGKKNGNRRNRQGACVAGCSDVMISMMKAARKQNTYLKQFNRLVKGKAQAEKKGGKKGNFGVNDTEGPLTLLIAAGGGNGSDLSCAGSKTNKKALLMANLTNELSKCEGDLGSKCNTSKFSVIKPEWTACNTSMLSFKTEADKCLKLTGSAACTCFNASTLVDLQKKVENCSATEMAAASTADGKLKKACIKTYGACRQGGESIRPVLAACQAGGATEDEMKADLGNVLKNDAATTAVTAAIDKAIAAASGRKAAQTKSKRAVSISGSSYEVDTCANWITAITAFLDAVIKSPKTDNSAAGTEMAANIPTCTSADTAGLTAAKAKGATAKAKIAKTKSMLKKNLESVSGAPISETELSALQAATTAAPANAATKASRRRHKILAEFRQRL